MLKRFLPAAMAAAIAVVGGEAAAETRVLKVQTSQNAGDATLTYLREKWVPRVETMSGGSLKLKLLPTGSTVPPKQTIDAVANGILDGQITAVSYFSGRDPVFALIGDLIAGYDRPDQVQMFCMNGGGKEILQTAMDKYTDNGVHVVGCGAYYKEAFVSTVPIRGVDDFEGIKVRSPGGLASAVFERAGATPAPIPFSEVYTSLEKGLIDAADASSYLNNASKGFYQVAPYPIYPGIHSMSVQDFTINADVWESLSAPDREVLRTWYLAAFTDLRRHSQIEGRELAAKHRSGDGPVKEIIDWPQSERDRFREIAKGAWKNYAQQSDLARQAYESHLSFMKALGLLTE